MIHGLLTAVWCFGCVLLGAPAPFLFWPPAFYLGREVAQAEYRWIEYHGGKRVNCPWWCGFLPGAWNAKSVTDWAAPLGVALAAWAVQTAMQ